MARRWSPTTRQFLIALSRAKLRKKKNLKSECRDRVETPMEKHAGLLCSVGDCWIPPGTQKSSRCRWEIHHPCMRSLITYTSQTIFILFSRKKGKNLTEMTESVKWLNFVPRQRFCDCLEIHLHHQKIRDPLSRHQTFLLSDFAISIFQMKRVKALCFLEDTFIHLFESENEKCLRVCPLTLTFLRLVDFLWTLPTTLANLATSLPVQVRCPFDLGFFVVSRDLPVVNCWYFDVVLWPYLTKNHQCLAVEKFGDVLVFQMEVSVDDFVTMIGSKFSVLVVFVHWSTRMNICDICRVYPVITLQTYPRKCELSINNVYFPRSSRSNLVWQPASKSIDGAIFFSRAARKKRKFRIFRCSK